MPTREEINRKNRAILEEYHRQLKNLMILTKREYFANLPKRLGWQVAKPIEVYDFEGNKYSELPINLAIRYRHSLLVDDMVRCGVDIYKRGGKKNECAIHSLNGELKKEFRIDPNNDNHYINRIPDIELKRIYTTISRYQNLLESLPYILVGSAAAGGLIVGLLIADEQALSQYIITILPFLIKGIKDYSPFIASIWHAACGVAESMGNYKGTKEESDKNPEIIKPRTTSDAHYRTFFSVARYGLFASSYLALAYGKYNLYGGLLVGAMATDIVREAIKYNYLMQLPLANDIREIATRQELGRHFNLSAKRWKTLTKLIAAISNTLITFGWVFAPGGAGFFAMYTLAYLSTYILRATACHYISEHYAQLCRNEIRRRDKADRVGDLAVDPEWITEEGEQDARPPSPGEPAQDYFNNKLATGEVKNGASHFSGWHHAGAFGHFSMAILGYASYEDACRLAKDTKRLLNDTIDKHVVNNFNKILDNMMITNPEWQENIQAFKAWLAGTTTIDPADGYPQNEARREVIDALTKSNHGTFQPENCRATARQGNVDSTDLYRSMLAAIQTRK